MRALLLGFRTAGAAAKAGAADQSGLAAVEFGLLLPVMLTLFFGVFEVSQALACRADVTNVASTAADLIAQEQTVSSTDFTNVFSAVAAILYPYDSSKAQITITAINYDTSTNSLTSGKVAWSCAKNTTPRTTGTTINLPGGLMTASGSVIMSEVTYNYTARGSQWILKPFTMTNTFYTKPRRVAQIPAPSSCT